MAEYRLVYSETAKNQVSKLHPELKSIIRSRLDAVKEDPVFRQKTGEGVVGLSFSSGKTVSHYIQIK